MKTTHHTLNDKEATLVLGRELAQTIQGHPLIFLNGEVGAGKTTFAQGFIRQLLCSTEPIVSPTYTYVNTYCSAKITMFHFDLYRAASLEALYELGLTDMLEDTSAIRLVEWPSIVSSIIKPDIKVELFGSTPRQAQVDWFHPQS